MRPFWNVLLVVALLWGIGITAYFVGQAPASAEATIRFLAQHHAEAPTYESLVGEFTRNGLGIGLMPSVPVLLLALFMRSREKPVERRVIRPLPPRSPSQSRH